MLINILSSNFFVLFLLFCINFIKFDCYLFKNYCLFKILLMIICFAKSNFLISVGFDNQTFKNTIFNFCKTLFYFCFFKIFGLIMPISRPDAITLSKLSNIPPSNLNFSPFFNS